MSREFWNERYKNADYTYGTQPNSFLAASLKFLPETGKILCVAEGEGRNAVHLAKHGYIVSAIDISSEGKNKATKLAAANHVAFDYTVTDVNDYDFGEQRWDAVVSIFAHTDPATRKNTLQKTLKSLKIGGLFILETYHPKQLEQGYNTGGPQQLDWLVTIGELKQTFAGQKTIFEYEGERNVSEGSAHNGIAYVTQFIGQKRFS